MNTKKDIAMKKIFEDFEEFSNLILQQLDMLEQNINKFSIEGLEENRKIFDKNEKQFDQFEVKISERIINTIVLYQPMATDLRKIFAIYRMSLNLERIGDMIINILNYITRIKDPDIFQKNAELIENMLILSSQMVTKALLSFINNDKEYAIWTIKNDAVIDELNYKLLKKSITRGNLDDKAQKIMQSYINLKGIITDIERIADHATNIAEASIYASEGTDIRHKDLDYIRDHDES